MIEPLLQAEGALSVGLLDRAEALFQQVVAADPRNSIAVVGLARVALERLDEVGALTLARRAQVIDPENNPAQRMVQRLEEVLRARGVAVAPWTGPQAPAVPRPTAVAPSAVPRPPAVPPQKAAQPQVGPTPPTAVAPPAAGPPQKRQPGSRSYIDRLFRRGRSRP